MSKVYANTFQTFNVYVDRAMEHLTDAELRVLLYATRHIMGWQDKITSRTACMSLPMFERGFTVTHDDGTQSTYGGCGLSRAVVSKTLNSLEALGFLERAGFEQDKGQRWRLAEQPDWATLEARSAKRDEANKKRTAKATASRKTRGSNVGRTHLDGVVTSDDTSTEEGQNGVVTSDDTMVVTSDVPKQTQDQTHEYKDSATAGAVAASDDGKVIPFAVGAKRNPWYDAVSKVWEYRGAMNGAMVKMLQGQSDAPAWKIGNVAVAMTPDDVLDWAAWYRKTELKNNPDLNMLEDRMKIASSIERWDAIGRPRGNKAASPLDGLNIVDPWADAS